MFPPLLIPEKGSKAKDDSEIAASNTSALESGTGQAAAIKRSGSDRWSSMTEKSKEKAKEIGKRLHLSSSRPEEPEKNYDQELEQWMCKHSGGTLKEKPRSWP